MTYGNDFQLFLEVPWDPQGPPLEPPPGPLMEPQAPKPGAPWGGPWGSQIFSKTQKCLRAPLETVGSHFHKSYVTNNASALFIRQPENQRTLTFNNFEKVCQLFTYSLYQHDFGINKHIHSLFFLAKIQCYNDKRNYHFHNLPVS